jgi:hypothetical protein
VLLLMVNEFTLCHCDVAKQVGMHVARTSSKYVDKTGNVRYYESVLVRHTFRRGGKVHHETLSNLSAEAIAAVEAALKVQTLVAAGSEFTVTRALAHGDLAAVAAMAAKLGMPALLGLPCRSRALAIGLIISRVVRPASKLDTRAWWPDTTLGVDPGIAEESTPDCRSHRSPQSVF